MSADLTFRALRLHQNADAASGALLGFMIVFSPWAFGTTQPWSMWTMNLCGYGLGLLLLVKQFIRTRHGFRPARWDCLADSTIQRGNDSAPQHSAVPAPNLPHPASGIGSLSTLNPQPSTSSRLLTLALAVLTALILAFCLISALNARATYDPDQGSLIYHHHIKWLPHSYDRSSTWRAFWNYLALALAFWALRDWLLGLNSRETRALRQTQSSQPAADGSRITDPTPHLDPEPNLNPSASVSLRGPAPSEISNPKSTASVPANLLREPGSPVRNPRPSAPSADTPIHQPSSSPSSTLNLRFPHRLRWLFWVLSLNGALVAAEGIAQRLSGTNKLLWFMPTRLNREALSQFGPYAYRANGAQYLNLVWPATLGFWWALRRDARRRREASAGSAAWRHHLLLPCVLLMAAASIISTSRGGAIVAVGMLVLAVLILVTAMRRRHPITRFALVLFSLSALALGAYLGGEQLMERMRSFAPNFESREGLYRIAQSMARDHPLFGLGPGAFGPMFQFYLPSTGFDRLAQLHNDWLETRITFGWLGSVLIALAFVLVLARWFVPGGIRGRWPFTLLLWLSLAGCLLHARWDFPFQIYSIVFLALVLCAVLSTVSSRPAASGFQSSP